MERMVISIIAAALLGLGAWNLNQTFNLSIEIESIKGKIEVVEKGMKQLRNMISKDRQKDKEIMDQHRELFNLLESGSSSNSSYSYGD